MLLGWALTWFVTGYILITSTAAAILVTAEGPPAASCGLHAVALTLISGRDGGEHGVVACKSDSSGC